MVKDSYSIRLLCAAALTLASLLLPCADSSAESIGGSFGGGNGGNQALAPTDVAGYGPFAQANYNLIKARATNLTLKNQNGAATAVTLTTSGANDFSAIAPAAAGPDEILNNDRARSLNGLWSFTLSNISYASYSILVYDMQSSAGAVTSISLGSTTYYTSSPLYNAPGYIDNDAATPFTYTQSTSTDPNAPTAASNFVMFTGLSGASATITVDGGGRLGGFQIVEDGVVPEPSTYTLLGIGVVALGALGRRRFSRSLPEHLLGRLFGRIA